MERKKFTLKEYCQARGFNSVSVVRVNTSGYLYVTLLNKDFVEETENLYLSKTYQAQVNVGDRLPINELFAVETTNEQGEIRWKLTNNGGALSEAKLADYDSFM